LNAQNFKPVEFDGFRKEAGLNGFVMTPTRTPDKTESNSHSTNERAAGSGKPQTAAVKSQAKIFMLPLPQNINGIR
jgi:hypothetical protein